MEQLKESIKFYTEVFKLFAILLIADSGGVVSLITSDKAGASKFVFIFFGLIIAFVSIVVIYYLQGNIRRMIRNLTVTV